MAAHIGNHNGFYVQIEYFLYANAYKIVKIDHIRE